MPIRARTIKLSVLTIVGVAALAATLLAGEASGRAQAEVGVVAHRAQEAIAPAPYIQTIGLRIADKVEAPPTPPQPRPDPVQHPEPRSLLSAADPDVRNPATEVAVDSVRPTSKTLRVPVGVVVDPLPAVETVTPDSAPAATQVATSAAPTAPVQVSPPVAVPPRDADIDWSQAIKIGDLVPTERDLLYRRAVTTLDYPSISARALIKELAGLSGIEYMMGPFEDRTLSLTVQRNPFRALENVVDNLGMGLVKKNDMYVITAVDKTTLTPHTYKFQHIHLDREFSFREPDEKTTMSTSSSSAGLGTAGAAALGGLGGSGTSGTYEKVTSRSNTQSPRAASERAKDNFVLARIQQLLDGKGTKQKPDETKGLLKEATHEQVESPEPIYDGDSNSLFVVTTDEKWGWIQEFLEEIDQETYNIWVTLRFVTTAKNDHSQKGINWAGGSHGGLGNGIAFTAENAATTTDTSTTAAASSGSGMISLGTLDHIVRPSAILSASALEAKLHFYATDGRSQMSKTSSFVAENNREVVFNLTQNRPVAVPSSTTNNTSGGAIVSAGMNVANEEVGIVVRVLAQTVRNGRVRATTKVEITNIVGGVVVNSIEYPEIQRSSVNSSPILRAGSTVELGGLEQVITSTTKEKIPLLGDIPILGIPFRDVVKGMDVTSLNLLVTIRLLDDEGNEVIFDANGRKTLIPYTGPRVKTVEQLLTENAKH